MNEIIKIENEIKKILNNIATAEEEIKKQQSVIEASIKLLEDNKDKLLTAKLKEAKVICTLYFGYLNCSGMGTVSYKHGFKTKEELIKFIKEYPCENERYKFVEPTDENIQRVDLLEEFEGRKHVFVSYGDKYNLKIFDDINIININCYNNGDISEKFSSNCWKEDDSYLFDKLDLFKCFKNNGITISNKLIKKAEKTLKNEFDLL